MQSTEGGLGLGLGLGLVRSQVSGWESQGRREPERAPVHNLLAGPSDIFSFNSVILK